MNFIDKALAEFTNGEDFVQKMADIYEYPEVREELANYPTWIRNIITVIDYDTELATLVQTKNNHALLEQRIYRKFLDLSVLCNYEFTVGKELLSIGLNIFEMSGDISCRH